MEFEGLETTSVTQDVYGTQVIEVNGSNFFCFKPEITLGDGIISFLLLLLLCFFVIKELLDKIWWK